MSDLAIPFSLSDVLERVVPGGLLISAAALAFHGQLQGSAEIAASPLGYAAFLAGSYALGVSVNSLANLIPITGYRRYWSDKPSSMEAAVRRSIERHFGLTADDRTWRLCYGTVIKQGYGANTNLFLGLDVFCHAMTVASVLALSIFLCAGGIALCRGVPELRYVLFAAGAFVLAFLFQRGARIYSQAFVGSIYEGFFNWWCDERKAGTSGSEDESLASS
jgi:hypothetical protein